MSKSISRSITLITALLFSTFSYAQTTQWTVDGKQSPVTFVATGKPGFLKINGENANVEGSFESNAGKLKGTFTVGLTSLKTGIDLRDEHMKDKFFEVGKHPTATLHIDETPSTLDGKEQPFKGRLVLKGIEKPVEGVLNLKEDGAKAEGKANFEIKLSDYPEIGVPSYKGITVAQSVKIEVALKADKK